MSASRRTDIPAFFADWFFARIAAGEIFIRNAFNFSRVSRIAISPDNVAGIVFWTKNPAPMLSRLNEIRAYPFYFQFTLNAYADDIEPNIPSLPTRITSLRELAEKIGCERVFWRYDPIIINAEYPADFHRDKFQFLAQQLRGFVKNVTISFVDTSYRNVRRNFFRGDGSFAIPEIFPETRQNLGRDLARIADDNYLKIYACAEKSDLTASHILPAKCVDGEVFAELRDLAGLPKINLKKANRKDKNQRQECGCAASIDIGAFNTCRHGCRYCYANYQPATITENVATYRSDARLLTGKISPKDIVTDHRGMFAFDCER